MTFIYPCPLHILPLLTVFHYRLQVRGWGPVPSSRTSWLRTVNRSAHLHHLLAARSGTWLRTVNFTTQRLRTNHTLRYHTLHLSGKEGETATSVNYLYILLPSNSDLNNHEHQITLHTIDVYCLVVSFYFLFCILFRLLFSPIWVRYLCHSWVNHLFGFIFYLLLCTRI